MLGMNAGLSGYHRPESILANKKSILFDGVNDYVDGSSVVDNLSTVVGTFAVWVKLTTGSNNDGIWMISIGTATANKIGVLHNTGSDVIRFLYKGDNTAVNADYSITEASLISAGWTHIAGTWDAGSANEIKLYINGSLVDTTESLTDFEGTPDRSILGKSANADNTYWAGYLDEFALWNRVQPAAKIAEIYNGGVPRDLTEGFSSGLIQWLRFEEASGTVADYSDNSNTATVSGATQNQSETP